MKSKIEYNHIKDLDYFLKKADEMIDNVASIAALIDHTGGDREIVKLLRSYTLALENAKDGPPTRTSDSAKTYKMN